MNQSIIFNTQSEAFCLERLEHYANRLLQVTAWAPDGIWNYLFDQYCYYEEKYSTLQINAMLNELNNEKPGVPIIITTL